MNKKINYKNKKKLNKIKIKKHNKSLNYKQI